MEDAITWILPYLPKRLADVTQYYARQYQLEELRLCRNAPVSFVSGGRLRYSGVVCREGDLTQTLDCLCEHSMYSHMQTMAEGYIALPNGMRVGVCGRAVTEKDRILQICDVTSLHIRFFHSIPNADASILARLKRGEYRESALIYAAPGVGKTTILRALAQHLARLGTPRRVALVDSRMEIATSAIEEAGVAVLRGYPKAKGIEIAVRSLAPEYVLCDEIGNEADTEAILAQLHAGVALIATAHGDCLETLLKRPYFERLHTLHAFDFYYGIWRKETGVYDRITAWNEVV